MAAPLGPPKRRPGEAPKKKGGRASETFLVGGRTSFQRGSISSLGISRLSDRRSSRSSMYGQGPSSYKKDPRPLSDKSYQQTCIKKLRMFLMDHSYPRDVKPRMLQAPSTKEFLYILNFLLELIEPSLVINGIKLEDEIPFVLKFLGYPFPVSKNHLLSIGSPHSWPIMLGVLMWLIEGGYVDETADVLFAKGFDDNINDKEIEFDQMADLYRIYLERGDESEEFKAAIVAKDSLISSVVDTKRQQASEDEEQLIGLTAIRDELKKNSIETLDTQLKGLKKEYDTVYSQLSDVLIPNIEKTETKTHEIESLITTLTEQNDSLKSYMAELIEHIKNQPMSAKEAKELRQDIQEKKDSIQKMQYQTNEALKRINELQMTHNQSVLKIDEACQMVNSRLRELTAILPESACLLDVLLDYNSSKRADISVLEQLQEQSRLIKGGVLSFIDKESSKYAATEREVIELSSAISTLDNELVKIDLHLKKTEATLERMKLLLKQAKQSHEEAVQSDLNKKMSYEQKLIELQQQIEDRSTEEMVSSEKKRMKDETVTLYEALKERFALLQEICLEMMSFVESEKKKDQRLSEEFDELLSVFQSIKIQPIKRGKHSD